MTDSRDRLRGLAAQFTQPAAPQARERPQEPPQAPERHQNARHRPPHPPAAPQARTKVKTSLNLPEPLAARLRAWRGHTARPHGDAIVSALIAQLDNVRQTHAADAQRIELGLAPLTPTHTSRRVLVTFWATPAAIARLDEAAASLAMTRSALIAALLDPYLP